MGNISCHNAQREIEQTVSPELLSDAASRHLSSCAACEAVLQQHVSLQELLSGLGTVEAPGDFDFRLRARLARERAQSDRLFGMGGFSFSVRSGAIAAVLLVFGSALLFVSLTRSDNPETGNVAVTSPKPEVNQPGVAVAKPEAVNQTPKAAADEAVESAVAGVQEPVEVAPQRRRELTGQIATSRDGNRQVARDLSGTRAPVLTTDHYDVTYRTAAFPINAGHQSLKVSVDEGRGTSRTISLPAVSFGSQRSLSSNSTPLLASARDTW